MSTNYLGNKRRKLKFKGNKLKPDTNEQDSQTTKEKMEKIQKIIMPDNTYTKIKYKNEFYSIGEYLLIRDPSISEAYLIGKLLKIIPFNGVEKYPYWPSIEVQWYYLSLTILGITLKMI